VRDFFGFIGLVIPAANGTFEVYFRDHKNPKSEYYTQKEMDHLLNSTTFNKYEPKLEADFNLLNALKFTWADNGEDDIYVKGNSGYSEEEARNYIINGTWLVHSRHNIPDAYDSLVSDTVEELAASHNTKYNLLRVARDFTENTSNRIVIQDGFFEVHTGTEVGDFFYRCKSEAELHLVLKALEVLSKIERTW
jgi:hypothetical protein